MVKPGMGSGEWGIEQPLRTDIAGSAAATLFTPRPDQAGDALLLSDSPFPIPQSRL